MTFRHLLLPIAIMSLHAGIPQLAPAQSVSNSALGALSILPPQYQGYVVKLSADNGNPNPPQWYVLAYRGGPEAGLFSIAIADGEIVQEKPSLNLGELFKNPSPIAVERIAIDSPTAFEIAQELAAANGRDLDTVSYILQQTGPDSAPFGRSGAMIAEADTSDTSKSSPPAAPSFPRTACQTRRNMPLSPLARQSDCRRHAAVRTYRDDFKFS